MVVEMRRTVVKSNLQKAIPNHRKLKPSHNSFIMCL